MINLKYIFTGFSKNKFRRNVLIYLLCSGKVGDAGKFINNMSSSSSESILNELSHKTFKKDLVFDKINYELHNELLDIHYFKKINNIRILVLSILLFLFLMPFALGALNHFDLIVSSVVSIVATISFYLFIHIFTLFPEVKMLKYFYISLVFSSIDRNVKSTSGEEHSIKDFFLEKVKNNKFNQSFINNKEVKQEYEKIEEKNLELISKLEQFILNPNELKYKKDDFLSFLKMNKSTINSYLIEKEYGCPKIYKEIEKLVLLYSTVFKVDVEKLESAFHIFLNNLIDVLAKRKDYGSIGNILYAGYSNNSLIIVQFFHSYLQKEDVLSFILSNKNNNLDEFLKVLPKLLMNESNLIKKGKDVSDVISIYDSLRKRIPLSIYNRSIALLGDNNE